jgi:hypothetical protein
MSLHLAFSGGWLDLAYGISGVWALRSKTPLSCALWIGWEFSKAWPLIAWLNTHFFNIAPSSHILL